MGGRERGGQRLNPLPLPPHATRAGTSARIAGGGEGLVVESDRQFLTRRHARVDDDEEIGGGGGGWRGGEVRWKGRIGGLPRFIDRQTLAASPKLSEIKHRISRRARARARMSR